MKRIFSSRRDHYLARLTIFLITVALMAGMAGCVGVKYDLTIASIGGGSVPTPGERTFSYPEGKVVNLKAVAEEGYQFVNWTGDDVDTIANVNAAATTITMNRTYSITANFALEILEIWDWNDLNAVRDNLGTNYRLMNDLKSTTANYTQLANSTANERKGWEPIGTRRDPFTGSFDGQGYEIEDLFIERSDKDYVGLFGYVDDDGVVKNIGVVNATVAGSYYVGGLVGRSEAGNVTNSYFTGTVTGASYVGGLVGLNQGIVEGSHSEGGVNGTNQGVGGLVGYNAGGNVTNSYSTGSVNGSAEHVGGLVGRNQGIVEMSYSQGNVNGSAEHVGGLVGWNEGGDVSNSYSTGNVTGEDGVGGLVGWNEGGDVTNSYSTGNVTGDSRAGGLVGRTDEESSVSNSYSTGNVTGEDGVGGLVGFIDKSAVSNSHYNYDEVLINGDSVITTGALFGEDFDQWLANDKFLDVNERLSRENGYYAVNNVTDFKELLAFGQNSSLKFRLTDDVDLGNEPNFYIPYFAGEFDGNGHKISNLSFNSDFAYNVGLFGYLCLVGMVTHVGVENVNITGASFVGGLVGTSWEGDVSNSHCTGSVTGDEYVGGLVGCSYEESNVSDSYCTGSVTGDQYVGGLVGQNKYTVDNCAFTGNVTSEEGSYVGGLVGNNDGTVENSYSKGNVTGNIYVGGLAGFNDVGSIVRYSYSTGNVNGTEHVGALVGANRQALVSNCYSTGNVSGNSPVGGLVGENAGTVSRSFWDIETSGHDTSDGGIGKSTAEMQDVSTFLEAGWKIAAVPNRDMPDLRYDWNIVNAQTYPFLNWE